MADSLLSQNRVPSLLIANVAGSSPLRVTGLSLTNATPIHVAVVDATGNQITSFSGSGGNANGQALMANSAPVVIASDQSAIPVTNTTLSVVGGGVAASAQRVVIADDRGFPSGSNIIGKVTTDQTTHGTTDLVAADITKINGGAAFPLEANTFADSKIGFMAFARNSGSGAGTAVKALMVDANNFLLVSSGATGAAVPSSALYAAAQARSSEQTATTNAFLIGLITDLVGKLIVMPYANPENLINGTTAAIVDTTSTSTIAAQAAGVRSYITQITVTNSHATVGTFVKILDGTTIIYEGYAAAAGGGFTASFPAPLRGSTATAINTQCVTTGANVIASVSGYKGV